MAGTLYPCTSLNNYLISFQVGIVAFLPSPVEDADEEEEAGSAQLWDTSTGKPLPLFFNLEPRLQDLEVNANSPILRLTKGGRILQGKTLF